MKITTEVQVNPKRVRALNTKNYSKGSVVYWMSRDQRVRDNWALLLARQIAEDKKERLTIVFSLTPSFLGATLRQYDFMLKGLKEVADDCSKKNINFELLMGSPDETIGEYCNKENVGILITDFSPLRISEKWHKNIKSKIDIPFLQVDAHNIVPVWVTSKKQEYAARTIRPKIHKHLDEFLTDFPILKDMPKSNLSSNTPNFDKFYKSLNVDESVQPVTWLIPGEESAIKVAETFKQKKIIEYDTLRNDPTKDFLSNLSPYLHFGQISAQRVALETKESEVFIEELVVRKELSDNFCFYNKNYDSFEGLADWAKETLQEHAKDKREFLYSKKEFEGAKTHDKAWNAAQIQMVETGKMHGYMRMYWAKKILEWTKSPKEALEIAIYLNDKYELDGRDPNGYVGIMWSIGGIHDRGWTERDVFGKIRYMNFNGLKRKFDIEKYNERYIS